jgi:hypothetical protein
MNTLLHFDGTNGTQVFTDNGLLPVTWTPRGAGAVLSTSVKKYGTASFQTTNNTNAGIYTPNATQWNFGTQDFCIQFWMYVQTDPAASAWLINKALSGAVGPFGIYHVPSGSGRKVGFQASTDGVSQQVNLASTSGLVLTTWTHIAFTREGTTFRGFFGGALEATATVSGALYSNATRVSLGLDGSSTNATAFQGYIDDFAVTLGSAVYTSTFTPTGPITNP